MTSAVSQKEKLRPSRKRYSTSGSNNAAWQISLHESDPVLGESPSVTASWARKSRAIIGGGLDN